MDCGPAKRTGAVTHPKTATSLRETGRIEVDLPRPFLCGACHKFGHGSSEGAVGNLPNRSQDFQHFVPAEPSLHRIRIPTCLCGFLLPSIYSSDRSVNPWKSKEPENGPPLPRPIMPRARSWVTSWWRVKTNRTPLAKGKMQIPARRDRGPEKIKDLVRVVF